jgi:hypothetical protein
MPGSQECELRTDLMRAKLECSLVVPNRWHTKKSLFQRKAHLQVLSHETHTTCSTYVISISIGVARRRYNLLISVNREFDRGN